MRPAFTPIAEQEYLEAIEFYQELSVELAERFVESMENELTRLGSSPLAFRRYGKHARLMLCSDFPYKILYLPPDGTSREVCVVLGIFHHSRNPRHLQGRR